MLKTSAEVKCRKATPQAVQTTTFLLNVFTKLDLPTYKDGMVFLLEVVARRLTAPCLTAG